MRPLLDAVNFWISGSFSLSLSWQFCGYCAFKCEWCSGFFLLGTDYDWASRPAQTRFNTATNARHSNASSTFGIYNVFNEKTEESLWILSFIWLSNCRKDFRAIRGVKLLEWSASTRGLCRIKLWSKPSNQLRRPSCVNCFAFWCWVGSSFLVVSFIFTASTYTVYTHTHTADDIACVLDWLWSIPSALKWWMSFDIWIVYVSNTAVTTPK